MNPSIILHLTNIAAGHHSLAGYLTPEQIGELSAEYFNLHATSADWMSFQHNSAIGFANVVVDSTAPTTTYYAIVVVDCVAYTVVLKVGVDGCLQFDDGNDFLFNG